MQPAICWGPDGPTAPCLQEMGHGDTTVYPRETEATPQGLPTLLCLFSAFPGCPNAPEAEEVP